MKDLIINNDFFDRMVYLYIYTFGSVIENDFWTPPPPPINLVHFVKLIMWPQRRPLSLS